MTTEQVQSKLRRHSYICPTCQKYPASNLAWIHFVLDSFGHLFPQTPDGELHPVAAETLSILASSPPFMTVLRRGQELRGTPGKNQKDE